MSTTEQIVEITDPAYKESRRHVRVDLSRAAGAVAVVADCHINPQIGPTHPSILAPNFREVELPVELMP